MITSAVSSTTSMTTMLGLGLTAGSFLLCLLLVALLVAKELSITYPDVDGRVVDAMNAALLPLLFAFVAIVGLNAV